MLARDALLQLIPQAHKAQGIALLDKLERSVQLKLYELVRAEANRELTQILESGSDSEQYKLLCTIATLIQPKG